MPSDTSEDIAARTSELLLTVLERNNLSTADLVSVILTATPDLHADFPAVAARRIGLQHTPLLCCQEIAVDGAIERCVRVLMHCYVDESRPPRHVYLHEARQLRLDLAE